MDPYIESCGLWEDFHESLINEIHAAAARVVPDRYVVRFGERSYVVLAVAGDLDPDRWGMQADVAIMESTARARPPQRRASAGPAAMAEEEGAVAMHAFVDAEFRESFVEIHALHPERRLVTTIEVLSPSNKRFESVGWNQYARKRSAHLLGAANLVEIDLLRGGTRMPMIEPWPVSPYYLLVSRKQKAPRCLVWPAYFDRPLPKLRVALVPPDEDIVLDLGSMVDAIYERSRYAVDIDYSLPCNPPLDGNAATWLRKRLEESK
jgi:hypothetical protein